MNLIFTHDSGVRYRMRKLDPGWVLEKWDTGGNEITRGKNKGSLSKAGWKSMGLYPHDVHHAYSIIAEDFMDTTQGDYDITDGLTLVAKYLRSLKVTADKAKEVLNV